MNSMIFLVSLISFVSLCQGLTPTLDGTAAVDSLVTSLGLDERNLKVGLIPAMASKTVDEQTALKIATATGGQIIRDLIYLGPDVISTAKYTTLPEPMANNFLDRILVTCQLDTALAITSGNKAKALTGLATDIGLRAAPKMGLLKSDVGLLTDTEILTEGATFIAAVDASAATATTIQAAVDPFTKKIATKANGITINKIAVAVNAGTLDILKTLMETTFNGLGDAEEVILEQSVKTLQPGEIKELGTAVTTAGDITTAVQITALFTSIDTAALAKSTTINTLFTALNDTLTGTQPAKLTTAITTAYEVLTLAKKTELQTSTKALKAAQIQTAGADLIAAVKLSDDVVPPDTVTTFFNTINAVANNSPVTQCSVALLIASIAASAMCRSIGFY